VNKRHVEHHPLRDGDRIQLGGSTIIYLDDQDPHATEIDTEGFEEGPELSARELEVLTLLARGLTDREIAERLFISASTVRSHLDRIGEKTGLRRRAALTRLAIGMGIAT
jgi:DNA-binding NarL/FixJ family response regulator